MLAMKGSKTMSNSQAIKYVGIRLAISAFVIALLTNATQSLVLYIGGNGLTDQPGGVLAFSLASFIVGTIFSTVVHFFIFGVATVMGMILFGIVRGSRKNSDDVGTPTPTAGSNAAFASFFKKFAIVVVSIAALLSAYQAIGLYVLLSAVSPAAGLILLTTVLTFVTTLIYGTAVIGFIGAVATFMVVMLMAFFGGRSNNAAK